MGPAGGERSCCNCSISWERRSQNWTVRWSNRPTRGRRRLITHPGVGPISALAFTLTMGPAQRFQRGKQIASYLGLIPSEYSSGGRRQRLGHISKQGNPFLRGLLVEAAQSAVRYEPEMRRAYQRLAQRKCRVLAKVAMARKLEVRLYWMLRLQGDYAQLIQGSNAGRPGTFRGRG
jgi:transposase